jgi:putative transposase
MIAYDAISPRAAIRQRKWAAKVHRPLDEATLQRIRNATATGLPYGDDQWIQRLAKKLHLDLTIRPRGRPKKHAPANK